jgi:hypothetical protein
MVVLVLGRGKPANHPWNVFSVVLNGCVGSRSGKPANHPWNVFSVVLYGSVGSKTQETCQPSLDCVSCGSLWLCWF